MKVRHFLVTNKTGYWEKVRKQILPDIEDRKEVMSHTDQ